MVDNPEIPEPQEAPRDEAAIPGVSGNGNGPAPGEPGSIENPIRHIDPEKLIQWMKATDKEIKMVRIGQVVLCGAVLLLLFTSAKSLKVPVAP